LIVPLELPGADGADGANASDLADRIGSARPRAHTLAVVILVPDGDGEPRAAVAAGAVFCTLPCPPADLVATVAKQLASRRRLGGPAS
jgi:hypothetical protein